jgi:hypothetical protein
MQLYWTIDRSCSAGSASVFNSKESPDYPPPVTWQVCLQIRPPCPIVAQHPSSGPHPGHCVDGQFSGPAENEPSRALAGSLQEWRGMQIPEQFLLLSDIKCW